MYCVSGYQKKPRHFFLIFSDSLLTLIQREMCGNSLFLIVFKVLIIFSTKIDWYHAQAILEICTCKQTTDHLYELKLTEDQVLIPVERRT